jgi:hypothetical protein
LDSTLVYIDNDIILKLCACDLFWEAIATLGLEKENLRVLDSAQFVFRGNKKVKKQYEDKVRESAISVVTPLETVKANDFHPLRNLNLPDVDPGELLLIGNAITQRSFYFMSGDKKCFRALGRHKALAEAREKLCGRVICLEQVIRFLIEARGFDLVRDRIVPVRECDQALKAIFGSGGRSEKKKSLETLSSYLEDIERDCPGLLAPMRLL